MASKASLETPALGRSCSSDYAVFFKLIHRNRYTLCRVQRHKAYQPNSCGTSTYFGKMSDIEGNPQAGHHIYNHLKKIEFFSGCGFLITRFLQPSRYP